MNQIKINEFIACSRKEKGMTQKELAEKIGVSDKTISKWETGNSTPDILFLEPLCKALDLSINELLSGEKISPEEYSIKAEENMLCLIQENQKSKKRVYLQYILGIILLSAVILLMFMDFSLSVIWYIDIPSFVIPACICMGLVLISGKRTKEEIVKLLRVIIIPVGCIIMLVRIPALLLALTNTGMIGPNLAVMVLTMLYVMIVYVILVLIEQKI